MEERTLSFVWAPTFRLLCAIIQTSTQKHHHLRLQSQSWSTAVLTLSAQTSSMHLLLWQGLKKVLFPWSPCLLFWKCSYRSRLPTNACLKFQWWCPFYEYQQAEGAKSFIEDPRHVHSLLYRKRSMSLRALKCSLLKSVTSIQVEIDILDGSYKAHAFPANLDNQNGALVSIYPSILFATLWPIQWIFPWVLYAISQICMLIWSAQLKISRM